MIYFVVLGQNRYEAYSLKLAKRMVESFAVRGFRDAWILVAPA